MSISIIIPTFNEAGCIATTIRSLRAQAPAEIIVVDGGSSDDTIRAASEADAVLTSAPERARQMNAGAQSARGEVLLFLHADCRPGPGALRAMERILTRP